MFQKKGIFRAPFTHKPLDLRPLNCPPPPPPLPKGAQLTPPPPPPNPTETDPRASEVTQTQKSAKMKMEFLESARRGHGGAVSSLLCATPPPQVEVGRRLSRGGGGLEGGSGRGLKALLPQWENASPPPLCLRLTNDSSGVDLRPLHCPPTPPPFQYKPGVWGGGGSFKQLSTPLFLSAGPGSGVRCRPIARQSPPLHGEREAGQGLGGGGGCGRAAGHQQHTKGVTRGCAAGGGHQGGPGAGGGGGQWPKTDGGSERPVV